MRQSAIVAALEALEAGDVELCEAILLDAREDGLSRREHVCPECGLHFDYPGQRAGHLLNVHGAEEAA
jgi:hypothetical protein